MLYILLSGMTGLGFSSGVFIPCTYENTTLHYVPTPQLHQPSLRCLVFLLSPWKCFQVKSSRSNFSFIPCPSALNSAFWILLTQDWHAYEMGQAIRDRP